VPTFFLNENSCFTIETSLIPGSLLIFQKLVKIIHFMLLLFPSVDVNKIEPSDYCKVLSKHFLEI
jgi:hypothetical protein